MISDYYDSIVCVAGVAAAGLIFCRAKIIPFARELKMREKYLKQNSNSEEKPVGTSIDELADGVPGKFNVSEVNSWDEDLKYITGVISDGKKRMDIEVSQNNFKDINERKTIKDILNDASLNDGKVVVLGKFICSGTILEVEKISGHADGYEYELGHQQI
jgi:hypothetical protein